MVFWNKKYLSLINIKINKINVRHFESEGKKRAHFE